MKYPDLTITILEHCTGILVHRFKRDLICCGGHTLKNLCPLQIYAWLKEMAQKYDKIATIISAGKSFEGRDLMGLRIAHKPDLPIVFIEAGIHAREWIAPATATWIIQQVLNTTSELIKSYEWRVFPSVNPDGYVTTQKVFSQYVLDLPKLT